MAPVAEAIIVGWAQLYRADIIMISPTRFSVGGSARLVRLAISHMVVISGMYFCRPRMAKIVRVLVRS